MTGTSGSQLPPEVVALEDPPTDGITCLSYLGPKPLVASTSWDGSLRVHETTSRALMLSHMMQSGPLLSLAVQAGDGNPAQYLYTGGMDGAVHKLDIETSIDTVVGRHESSTPNHRATCSCLSTLGKHTIASAGWHNMVHIWDTRTSGSPVATVALPGKAFSMDVDPKRYNLLAVATSGRRLCFIDVRKADANKHNTDPSSDVDMQPPTAELNLDRESSLKYQTRCLRFFPDGNAIAIGSIEGRAAVEYLDDLNGRKDRPVGKKYAFKCHRVGDMVYPVNAIEFHPTYGTFATGGCDGTVVLWDGMNKKKISSLPAFPTAVAAMAFNHDGSELAVAASYTFEEGEREHPKDEIYIRPMLESECAPKAKS